MRLLRYFRSNLALSLALLWVLAGCSTNAGFGTPVSGPNPVTNNNPYGQSVPGPTASGSLPYDARPGVGPLSTPYGSPTPTPTAAPNTLSLVGPALRLAYDGSAKDPVKAPRVLELSFALQNTTKNGAKISTVSAYADKTALGTSPVTVTAAAGQTSEVVAAALKTSDDPVKYKEMMLTFLDDSKKMVASQKLEVPPLDTSFTSLDEKHPKGPFSIDSAEISPISVGQGLSFECTFALTNATASNVSVTQFEIKPPKGDLIKLAIPIDVPARSVSGFISIVVPYTGGKSLPTGSYSIRAVLTNGRTAAKTSAVLL